MSPITAQDDALITTFGRLLEAHSHLVKQLGRSLDQQVGVPHAWFEVLLRIDRSDGGQVSMGVLAQQVALTSGGTTKLVDRMTEAGLVQRVPCPSDRRVHFAALTTKGEDVLHQAKGVHARDLRQVFAAFSGDDVRTLDRLLDGLRAAVVD